MMRFCAPQPLLQSGDGPLGLVEQRFVVTSQRLHYCLDTQERLACVWRPDDDDYGLLFDEIGDVPFLWRQLQSEELVEQKTLITQPAQERIAGVRFGNLFGHHALEPPECGVPRRHVRLRRIDLPSLQLLAEELCDCGTIAARSSRVKPVRG